MLHTHRGPGGGLLAAHTKVSSFDTKHFGVTVSKATEKGYLKDPDSTKKPKPKPKR